MGMLNALVWGRDPRSHISKVVVGNNYIYAITFHSGPMGYKVEVVMPNNNNVVMSDKVVYDNPRQAFKAVQNFLEQNTL